MTIRSSKGESVEAAQHGAAAVAAALGVKPRSTPGQVLSDKPVPRKPVVTVKGPEKAPSKATGKRAGAKAGQVPVEVPLAPVSPVSVAAAKPVRLTKGAAAIANADNIGGYPLHKFGLGHDGAVRPWAGDIPAPDLADILAARALNVVRAVTVNELALACYLGRCGRLANVYEIGQAIALPGGGNGDHKMNVVIKARAAGLVEFVSVDGVFTGHAGKVGYHNGHPQAGKSAAMYAVRPLPAGLALITAALTAAGIEVPEYMRLSDTEIAASGEAAKAAKKAARDAAKAAKGQQPAAAAKVKAGAAKRK